MTVMPGGDELCARPSTMPDGDSWPVGAMPELPMRVMFALLATLADDRVAVSRELPAVKVSPPERNAAG